MKIESKISFLGTGNMARAIIDGLIKNKTVDSNNIYVSDINKSAIKEYANKQGVNMCSNNIEAVSGADIIVLSIKPNTLSEVLEEIKCCAANKLVISIVTGASIAKIKEVLGQKCSIVRTMPNTPAMVSEGMTVITYDSAVSEKEREIAEGIFQSIGKIAVLDEKYLNSVVALTSSSPAYFFIMIEAMADAAVLSGIPRSISYEMAAQAMLGSAKLLLETKKHPGELKDMVCSPAGTTIEAVAELERRGFRDAVISAMKSCTDKANQI